jgi:hypothetical protein
MSPNKHLTEDERSKIETLILAFDNHGCGMGLDIQAQAALGRLLATKDDTEQAAEQYRALPQERGCNI